MVVGVSGFMHLSRLDGWCHRLQPPSRQHLCVGHVELFYCFRIFVRRPEDVVSLCMIRRFILMQKCHTIEVWRDEEVWFEAEVSRDAGITWCRRHVMQASHDAGITWCRCHVMQVSRDAGVMWSRCVTKAHQMLQNQIQKCKLQMKFINTTVNDLTFKGSLSKISIEGRCAIISYTFLLKSKDCWYNL